jgi:hypothetical protein
MTRQIKIKTRSTHSQYVALDAQRKSTVLAEGRKLQSVVAKAEKTGRSFSLAYIPAPGKTFIF